MIPVRWLQCSTSISKGLLPHNFGEDWMYFLQGSTRNMYGNVWNIIGKYSAKVRKMWNIYSK